MEAYTENGKKKINYEDLDNSVLAWFHSKRSKGALINGAMIVQKAKEIAKGSIKENFSASKRWLHKFKQRHNLKI